MGAILATTSSLAQWPEPAKLAPPDMDSPNLPLSQNEKNLDQISLGDLAIALDFSDQAQKGDWAISFEKIVSKGNYMELLRAAEGVIDTFENEGVYVEDLAIEMPSDGAWRSLAKHKRNSLTSTLAFVKDPSTQTLIRARL